MILQQPVSVEQQPACAEALEDETDDDRPLSARAADVVPSSDKFGYVNLLS